MSYTVKVTLPDPVAAQLRDLAASAQQPLSRLAGQMVQSAVARAVKDGKVRAPNPATPLLAGKGAERPAWLEPYGGDPSWRRLMWGAIVALHGRYPRALEHLNDGWWTDEQHTETLCALAVWRAEIDDGGRDPREELAFQTQLNDYSHTLRQEARSVTQTWEPGAPPEEWAGR